MGSNYMCVKEYHKYCYCISKSVLITMFPGHKVNLKTQIPWVIILRKMEIKWAQIIFYFLKTSSYFTGDFINTT